MVVQSLRVAFPAACGVTCSRQRARRPAHRCTRTAHPFFSEYPAPWGGDPLLGQPFPPGIEPAALSVLWPKPTVTRELRGRAAHSRGRGAAWPTAASAPG